MGAQPKTSQNQGVRWLIVEDETLISLLIEDAVAEMGLEPVGPATSVAKALEFIQRERFAGAILDINLGGETVYPVARVLASQGIPFTFLTGYGEAGLSRDFAGHPVLSKPFTVEEVQTAVRRLREAAQADS